MTRRVGRFSAGAASAIACHLGDVERIVYAETGSEDADNERFIRDCEAMLFSVPVERVRSAKFRDTWDVWERERFLGGVHGAPCTRALKRIPLAAADAETDSSSSATRPRSGGGPRRSPTMPATGSPSRSSNAASPSRRAAPCSPSTASPSLASTRWASTTRIASRAARPCPELLAAHPPALPGGIRALRGAGAVHREGPRASVVEGWLHPPRRAARRGTRGEVETPACDLLCQIALDDGGR